MSINEVLCEIEYLKYDIGFLIVYWLLKWLVVCEG